MEYCSVVLICFVSFFLLLNHWSENKGIIYLVVSIVLFTMIQFTILVMNTTRSPLLLAFLTSHFDPLYAMVGPFVLYYFKSLIKEKFKFDNYLLLLALPSIIIAINLIPYYSIPFNSKVIYFTYIRFDSNPLPSYLFLPIQYQLDIIMVYNFMLILYGMQYIYKIKKSSYYSKRNKLISLINQILILLFFIILGDFILVFFCGTTSENYFETKNVNPLINNNYLCFYVNMILPIFTILNPNLLYNSKRPITIIPDLTKLNPSISTAITIQELSLEKKEIEKQKIINYINNEKPYLDNNFSIHDISTKLNIPYARVTNCFNHSMKIPFTTYRNQLRIEYAIIQFRDGEHLTTSIDGIAYRSGFTSKTVFYEVFKQYYGITPAKWIKLNCQ